MNLELPDYLQTIKNAAIDHFWSKAGEAPDLTPLHDWFNEGSEGWDDLYSCFVGRCLWLDSLADSWFYDESVRSDDLELSPDDEISDLRRIQHARKWVQVRYNSYTDSVHAIELEKVGSKPVLLIFIVSEEGPGWEISIEGIYGSLDEFMDQFNGMLIFDPNDLTDEKILSLWQKI